MGVLGFSQLEYEEIKSFVEANEGLITNDIDLIMKKHKEQQISFLVNKFFYKFRLLKNQNYKNMKNF